MLAERDHWLNGQTMPDSRSNAQDPADTYCLGGLAGRKMGELKARTFRVVECKTDLPYRCYRYALGRLTPPPLHVLFDMIILELD